MGVLISECYLGITSAALTTAVLMVGETVREAIGLRVFGSVSLEMQVQRQSAYNARSPINTFLTPYLDAFFVGGDPAFLTSAHSQLSNTLGRNPQIGRAL